MSDFFEHHLTPRQQRAYEKFEARMEYLGDARRALEAVREIEELATLHGWSEIVPHLREIEYLLPEG